MSLLRHRCHFCGHKSREVDFIVGDSNWQCRWENRTECYERRWEKHPWERPEPRQILAEHRDRMRDVIEGRISVEEYVQAVKDEVNELLRERWGTP